MTEEFKKAFSNLSVDEKRNQISNELIIISELIKLKEESLKLPSVLSVKDYASNSNMTESEMLDFLYEDIYNIQKGWYKYMFKLLKKFFIFLIIVAICICAFITYKGYNLYKEVVSKESIAKKVEKIKEYDNYIEISDVPKTYK